MIENDAHLSQLLPPPIKRVEPKESGPNRESLLPPPDPLRNSLEDVQLNMWEYKSPSPAGRDTVAIGGKTRDEIIGSMSREEILLTKLEGERERCENLEIEKLKLELQLERDRAAKLEADLNNQERLLERENDAREQRLRIVDTELQRAQYTETPSHNAPPRADRVVSDSEDSQKSEEPLDAEHRLGDKFHASPTTKTHSFKVLEAYYPSNNDQDSPRVRLARGSPAVKSSATSHATARTHSFKALKMAGGLVAPASGKASAHGSAAPR